MLIHNGSLFAHGRCSIRYLAMPNNSHLSVRDLAKSRAQAVYLIYAVTALSQRDTTPGRRDSCRREGMTNYHIGPYRTTSDPIGLKWHHIGPHRATSA